MNSARKLTWVLLALILFVGLGLRAYRLDYQSIWGDERWDTWFASHSLAGLLNAVRENAFHPPLYYVLLHFWIKLAGTSAIALRLPPLVAGMVTILLTFLVARRFFPPSTALLGAAFGAVSQLAIMYSQDATSYALFMCLSVVETHAFAVAIQRNSRRDWVVLTVLTTCFVYTHYFAALVIIGQLLFLAIGIRRHRRAFSRFLLTCLVSYTLFLPWALGVTSELITTNRAIGPLVPVTWRSVDRILNRFNNGNGLGIHDPSPWWVVLLGFAAFTIPACAAVAHLCTARRRETGDPREGDGVVLCALLAGVPIVILFLASQLSSRFQFVYHRYVLISLAPYYILVARGYASIHVRWLRACLVASTITLSLLSCHALYRHYKPDWRGALTYVAEQMPDSALCMSTVDLRADLIRLNLPGRDLSVATLDPASIPLSAPDEIWLISVTWTHWHRRIAHRVAEVMAENYTAISRRPYRDMNLVVYHRRSQL